MPELGFSPACDGSHCEVCTKGSMALKPLSEHDGTVLSQPLSASENYASSGESVRMGLGDGVSHRMGGEGPCVLTWASNSSSQTCVCSFALAYGLELSSRARDYRLEG